MKDRIRQRALDLGFDGCRFTTADPPGHAGEFQKWIAEGQHGEMAWLGRNAHKRVEPKNILPGAHSIVALATSYSSDGSRDTATGSDKRGRQIPGAGNSKCGIIARYARYDDYHDVMAERLQTLTAFVNELGGGETRSLWYVDTGPLLERDIAHRAGLGFVGKHTNLIGRKLGNWILLAEIITTLELEPDTSEQNRCGNCVRCIAACPTDAITRPFNLDARRCISYLTIELKGSIPIELRPLIGNRIYGCDDCLAICPWNRFAREGAMMRPVARPDLREPDLINLLCLNDAAFKTRFAGTPIVRTRRRGLLRNVCVALGNVGDENALPALHRATLDPDPLVREHAVWAIGQIKARRRQSATEALPPAAKEA